MQDVVVIGAGASGLMAAIAALNAGAKVTVLEKNEKPGKKIYITGKGRCNVTNACTPEQFLEGVVTNAKFLTGAIHSFTPLDTAAFFQSKGVALVTERGGRLFPESGKASDITAALTAETARLGGSIITNQTVGRITADNGVCTGVQTLSGNAYGGRVILASGGASYPGTGSTGDGYSLAQKTGHTVIKIRPALVGIEIKDALCADIQGLSLKNVRLSAYSGERQIYSSFGEMLFTHYGISGPLVLSASSIISASSAYCTHLSIDLKPALGTQILDARLIRDFKENNGKMLKNSLGALLPKNLIPYVISKSGVSGDKKNTEITKTERAALVNALKSFNLIFSALRPTAEGIVTGGGVKVSQINPKTMESKLIKGLYFCGEVLDVDALTGGYNLQIAFSTGFCAGSACGKP